MARDRSRAGRRALTTPRSRSAVFLDRDGTINVEKNYLSLIKDWEWIEGSIEAIKALNAAGFLTIVVSNQAGIARGKYNISDVELLHSRVAAELAQYGGVIDDFYFCPHHPEFGADRNCSCRKPKPGMLVRASEKWNIDFDTSWMIGDKFIDVEAGRSAGVSTVLVRTGYGARDAEFVDDKQRVANNLFEAVTSYII